MHINDKHCPIRLNPLQVKQLEGILHKHQWRPHEVGELVVNSVSVEDNGEVRLSLAPGLSDREVLEGINAYSREISGRDSLAPDAIEFLLRSEAQRGRDCMIAHTIRLHLAVPGSNGLNRAKQEMVVCSKGMSIPTDFDLMVAFGAMWCRAYVTDDSRCLPPSQIIRGHAKSVGVCWYDNVGATIELIGDGAARGVAMAGLVPHVEQRWAWFHRLREALHRPAGTAVRPENLVTQ